MYKIVKIAYHLLWRPPHFREMYTFSVSCLVEASANASLVSFYSCMNVFDVSLVSKFLSFCRTHALQQNGVENIEAPPNSDATKKRFIIAVFFHPSFVFSFIYNSLHNHSIGGRTLEKILNFGGSMSQICGKQLD